MAQNGEVNTKFGVYRNACCGAEIVIAEGTTFPRCPKHPALVTVWQPIEFEIVDVITIKKKSRSDPAT